MPEQLESQIARIDERTESILGTVNRLADKMAEDHDILIPLHRQFMDHCDEHKANNGAFRWKIGVMVAVISIVVSAVVGLIGLIAS